MKTAIFGVVLCCILGALMLHGLAPREARTYENMQPQELHEVLCISEYGDAETYHIPMYLLEGFTLEEVHALEESYKQGFCNSLKQ